MCHETQICVVEDDVCRERRICVIGGRYLPPKANLFTVRWISLLRGGYVS